MDSGQPARQYGQCLTDWKWNDESGDGAQRMMRRDWNCKVGYRCDSAAMLHVKHRLRKAQWHPHCAGMPRSSKRTAIERFNGSERRGPYALLLLRDGMPSMRLRVGAPLAPTDCPFPNTAYA
jgi:hypothetical protein